MRETKERAQLTRGPALPDVGGRADGQELGFVLGPAELRRGGGPCRALMAAVADVGAYHHLMVLPVAFAGADSGRWRVEGMEAITGDLLPSVACVSVMEGPAAERAGERATWVLRGVTSNERYVTRREHDELAARQQPLGRAGSTRAALIPIKKSDAWWDLAQDERRRIFEESSLHVATGMEYLPQVARRLHHGRDLGEPFDFLTWFEFAPGNAAGFEELVRRLRATEEWAYVEREIDIRLAR